MGVLLVSTFWIFFLFFTSLFVVIQINTIEDYYIDEDGHTAWVVFWSVIGGVVPVVAFGGNFLRWKIYERWILLSGRKSRGSKSKSSKRGHHEEQHGEYEDEDGGSYVQMT